LFPQSLSIQGPNERVLVDFEKEGLISSNLLLGTSLDNTSTFTNDKNNHNSLATVNNNNNNNNDNNNRNLLQLEPDHKNHEKSKKETNAVAIASSLSSKKEVSLNVIKLIKIYVKSTLFILEIESSKSNNFTIELFHEWISIAQKNNDCALWSRGWFFYPTMTEVAYPSKRRERRKEARSVGQLSCYS